MKRRTILRSLGSWAAFAIPVSAGCTKPDPSGGGSPESPTGTVTETPTSGGPTLSGRSFEILNIGSETDSNKATITWLERTVRVTGVISGANGCYKAKLQNAEYDSEHDELQVDVKSYNSNPDGFCTQAKVYIDYRASFEFEGGLPRTVIVRHNGNPIERASSGSD